jgi:5'-3' exonuclease
MRVHLVDGTYELFRNHYGAPPAVDRAGRPAGAVRGLLRTLASLLRDPGVTHVGVAFDTVIESFRNDLFAGYKTSDGVDPDLLAQFQPAEQATHALGCLVWPMRRFEADDALATAAARCREADEVEQVVVCSPDKDLAQCVVGSRVVLLDRRRQVVIDEAAVIARWSVPPASIPDWLALVGDPADGLPGVPRWGPKSASAVLARYHRLEAIPPEVAGWQVAVRGAPALAASLRAHWEDVLLYRDLATLRTDVPIDTGLDALAWRGARSAELEEVCRALEFEEFLGVADSLRR